MFAEFVKARRAARTYPQRPEGASGEGSGEGEVPESNGHGDGSHQDEHDEPSPPTTPRNRASAP
jgi:hypothetical protein